MATFGALIKGRCKSVIVDTPVSKLYHRQGSEKKASSRRRYLWRYTGIEASRSSPAEIAICNAGPGSQRYRQRQLLTFRRLPMRVMACGTLQQGNLAASRGIKFRSTVTNPAVGITLGFDHRPKPRSSAHARSCVSRAPIEVPWSGCRRVMLRQDVTVRDRRTTRKPGS